MLDCANTTLDSLIPKIHNTVWRDQSYREQVKILTRQGRIDIAMDIIPKISSEDTRALTIRAIAIGLADLPLEFKKKNTYYFETLHKQAYAIKHEGSQEVALTYIAIGQAKAGLFEPALLTASMLKTASLRNKSYQEIAEILSVKGDVKLSLIALQEIDDANFSDKAYGVVAALLSKHNQLSSALKTAAYIQDPYIKTSTLLNIINAAEQHK